MTNQTSPKVSYEKDMANLLQTGDQWSNSIVVNFDCPNGPFVELAANFGSSYTFQSYNNLQYTLLDVPNATTPAGVQQIIDSIKESEETLIAIYEGFETFWDGSNTRGKLTEEAHELLEELQRSLANEFENGLPSFWSADDYFAYISSEEIGRTFMHSEASCIQGFWEDEYEDGTGEFEVKNHDAIRYLRNALTEFVENDLEGFLEERGSHEGDEEGFLVSQKLLDRAELLKAIVN